MVGDVGCEWMFRRDMARGKEAEEAEGGEEERE
jgi:hypothetical protein